jgi:hypothetical protein
MTLPPVTRIPKGWGVTATIKRQAALRRNWKTLSIEEKRKIMRGLKWTMKTERANDVPLPWEAE